METLILMQIKRQSVGFSFKAGIGAKFQLIKATPVSQRVHLFHISWLKHWWKIGAFSHSSTLTGMGEGAEGQVSLHSLHSENQEDLC